MASDDDIARARESLAARGWIPQAPGPITIPTVEMGPTPGPNAPIVMPTVATQMPVGRPAFATLADKLGPQLGSMAPPGGAPIAAPVAAPNYVAPPPSHPSYRATGPQRPSDADVYAAESGGPRRQQVAAQARPSGGGGGSAGGGIASLTAARKADEQKVVGSYDTEKDAVLQGSRADQVRAVEQADAMDRMAREQADASAEEAAQQRDFEATKASYLGDSDRLNAEIREAKVDPGRLYGNPRGASGALTAIALALGGAAGGMLQGLKGGSNTFLDTINQGIDRDIASQEGAIRNMKDAAAGRQNLFSQLRQTHGDSALARNQAKLAMLESTKTTMEAQAIRMGTPVAMANAERNGALIDRQKADLQRQISGAAEAGAIRQAQAAAAARAAAEEQRFKRGVELEKLRLEGRKIDVDEAKNEGGGKLDGRFVSTGQTKDAAGNTIPTGYMAASPEAAAKRKVGIDGSTRAMNLIGQILDRRDEQGTLGRTLSRTEGGIFGSPEWKVKNSADQQALVLAIKDAEQLGAISESDKGLITGLVGENPNSVGLFSDDTKVKLSQLRQNIQKRMEQEAATEAGTKVAKVVTPDGRSAYAPLGGANAPSNARTASVYMNADGSPKK